MELNSYIYLYIYVSFRTLKNASLQIKHQECMPRYFLQIFRIWSLLILK